MSKFKTVEALKSIIFPKKKEDVDKTQEKPLVLPQRFFEDDSYTVQEGVMRISFGFSEADIKNPSRKKWIDSNIRRLGYVNFSKEKKNEVVQLTLVQLRKMMLAEKILGGTITVFDQVSEVDTNTSQILIRVIPALRPMNANAKERFGVGDATIVRMPLFVDDPYQLRSWFLPQVRDSGNLIHGLDGLRISLEVFFWKKRIAHLQPLN